MLRSQNPALTNTTNGQPLPPLPMTASQQQFLAQQNAAYAAQAQVEYVHKLVTVERGHVVNGRHIFIRVRFERDAFVQTRKRDLRKRVK